MITTHLDADGLVAACEEAVNELAVQTTRAVDMAAHLVTATARKTTRFKDRSGHLRASIEAAAGSAAYGKVSAFAQAGANSIVHYARYIEDGTTVRTFSDDGSGSASGIEPRKFMASALEENTPAIENIVADAVELALLNAGFGR